MRTRRAVPGHGARAALLVALLTVLAPIMATSAAAASSPSPAQVPAPRADGLDIGATFTYTIDPPANVVRVVAEITLVNTVPNTTSGNIINKTYYDGFTVPVPIEAANGAAIQDGTPVTITTDAIDGVDSFLRLDVEFAKRIFYRQSTTLVVTYDIIGRAPRDPLTTRVNAAYTAFEAFGVGDPGKVTVRVVVPAGYTVDTLGSDVVRTEEGGSVVYTATNVADPEQFGVFVSARNDEMLASVDVTVGEDTFDVRPWPGDAEWQAFVTRYLEEGVPLLEEMTGVSWPVTAEVEIREAVTQELYGYAGWFNALSGELEIGETLDSNVLLHELSHGWFNRLWFDERWISEGLAQQYAGLADEALGQPAVEPEFVARNATGSQPLNEWATPDFTEGDDPTEDYGYAASWFAIDQIVDEVGVEAMRDVFAAVDEGLISYRDGDEPERIATTNDWRQFLDLLEEVGGATTAEDVLVMWALTDTEAAELSERSEARTRYDELDETAGDWSLPYAVRAKMHRWDFTGATDAIDEATETLAARDALVADLEPIDVELPGDVQERFEGERTSFDATNAVIDDLADAAERLEAAIDAAAEDRDLYTRLGLRGVDLDALLADASAALSANDTDDARALAAEVEQRLDDAPAIGRSRVLRIALAIGGGVLALIILIVVWVIVRRRRRRRAEEQGEEQQTAEAAAAPLTDDGPPLDTL